MAMYINKNKTISDMVTPIIDKKPRSNAPASPAPIANKLPCVFSFINYESLTAMYPSKNTITINKIISGLTVLKIHQMIPAIAVPNNINPINLGTSFKPSTFFLYFSGFSYFCFIAKYMISSKKPLKKTITKSGELIELYEGIKNPQNGAETIVSMAKNFTKKSSFCFAKSIFPTYHNLNLKSINSKPNLTFA